MVAVAHGSRDPRAAATVAELLGAVRDRRPGRAGPRLVPRPRPARARPRPGRPRPGRRGGRGRVAAAAHRRLPQQDRHPRRPEPGAGPPSAAAAPHGRDAGPAPAADGRPGAPSVRRRSGAGRPGHGRRPGLGGLQRRVRQRHHRAAGPRVAVARVVGRRPRLRVGRLPGPAEAVAALLEAGAPRVAVASYFLAPGHFADKVRAASLAAGAAAVSPSSGRPRRSPTWSSAGTRRPWPRRGRRPPCDRGVRRPGCRTRAERRDDSRRGQRSLPVAPPGGHGAAERGVVLVVDDLDVPHHGVGGDPDDGDAGPGPGLADLTLRSPRNA